MTELTGISASPGIAIGKVFLYTDETPHVPRYRIGADDVESELARYDAAAERAKEELEALREKSQNEMVNRDADFLDSHLMMLEDRDLRGGIEEHLREWQYNVEWVLVRHVERLVAKLDAASDEYLRERSSDIRDVSKRILNQLMHRERISLSDLEEEVILVCHDLLPSDAISMNQRRVMGIAMDAGGKTSHTAILARSFEIPAVLGLSTVVRSANTGDTIIVDGNRGKIIVHPDEQTLNRYQEVQREYRRREVKLMELNDLPAETKDGKLLHLKANIEVPEEVDAVLSHGAGGVGLYRSEFLFLRPGTLPSEEQQSAAYSQVLESMGDKPVTIRTLDLGGDKVVPRFEDLSEKNPILGWRAIRFCLSHMHIFRIQLRALLRASVRGNLRIMFPMISGVEELNQALEALEGAKAELRSEGIPFAPNVPVGIMIEVPSAALTSDILAKKVDFFSIGTNDLIQYTIAVDRGNENIAYLYEPFHPAVLRLLKSIIDSAHLAGIPVGMCGEMAGDPQATPILLGLGLDEFSMSAVGIPEIKRIIRSMSLVEAEEIVGRVLEMRSYTEIDAYMNDLMMERFDVVAY
jgi:phosphotransferase system enzyme I (PtsI)